MASSDNHANLDLNRAYYESPVPGREDYWRKMAAPRFRVATLLRIISDASPVSVVDLGCGGGQLLAEIRRRLPHIRLAGVDLSCAQVANNRARMPEIEWTALDLSQPFTPPIAWSGRFEMIVATELIEHIQTPDVLLRNAWHLAAPRGALVLSTQSGPLRETERRVGHLRHYTSEELRGLLGDTGWIPLRIWNCGFPFHDLSKWYANLNPDATMHRFGVMRYGILQDIVCLALRLAFHCNSRRRGAQLFAIARRA